jgi:hypothetical protein
MLTGAGGRPAGILLNRLPRRRGVGYYYYYASPGYGRGEGAYSRGFPIARNRRSPPGDKFHKPRSEK